MGASITDAQIDAISDELHDKYLAACTTPGVVPSQELCERFAAMQYRVAGLPCPPVRIVKSRVEALAIASKETGEKETSIDWVSVWYVGWLARREAGERLGILGLDDEEKSIMADVHIALDALSGGVFGSVALDGLFLAIPYASVLKFDSAGNLHCGDGPAVSWGDDDQEWAWHGVWIPRELTDGSEITPEMYSGYSTEVRRACGEIRGWQFVSDLLGASVIDSWKDQVTGLTYELLSGRGEKWLRKQSPVIKDGSQPTYIEPVHEDLESARAARRWQAPPYLTPAECEADPSLEYEHES